MPRIRSCGRPLAVARSEQRLDVLYTITPLSRARKADRSEPAAADIGIERVELDPEAARRLVAR